MATASSRNALDGRSIQRVTLYDGGGNPVTTLTVGGAFTLTKAALSALGPTGNMVGAVSTHAVASNGQRTGLVFTNTNGSLSVSLGVGTTAVINTGITLLPNGSWSIGEYDFSRSLINAIGSASGPILAIQEFN